MHFIEQRPQQIRDYRQHWLWHSANILLVADVLVLTKLDGMASDIAHLDGNGWQDWHNPRLGYQQARCRFRGDSGLLLFIQAWTQVPKYYITW